MTKWEALWGHANLPSGACPAWKAGSEADRRDAEEGAGVGAGAAAGVDLASTRPGRNGHAGGWQCGRGPQDRAGDCPALRGRGTGASVV